MSVQQLYPSTTFLMTNFKYALPLNAQCNLRVACQFAASVGFFFFFFFFRLARVLKHTFECQMCSSSQSSSVLPVSFFGGKKGGNVFRKVCLLSIKQNTQKRVDVCKVVVGG